MLHSILACCLVYLHASSASTLNTIYSHNESRASSSGWLGDVDWRNTSLAGDAAAAIDSTAALSEALASIWDKVRRPFVLQDTAPNVGDRLTTFRRKLLTEAKKLVTLYTHTTSFLPDKNRTEEAARGKVAAASVVGSSGSGQPRPKRDHPLDLPLYKGHNGMLVLETIEGVANLPVNGSLALHMVMWRGNMILAIIDSDLNLKLFTMDPQTLEKKLVLTMSGRLKCKMAKVSTDNLLLVCITREVPQKLAKSRTIEEVTVYLLREAEPGGTNLSVDFLQSIPTHSPSDVHVWSQEESWYMMVTEAMLRRASDEISLTANIHKTTTFSHHGLQSHYSHPHPPFRTTTTYHTTSSIYRWTGQYFDMIHKLPGTYPTSVLHFKTKNLNFIAMANFMNNKGEHNCYSYIFHHSLDMERYELHQQVFTMGALNFEAFTLGSGLDPHTYLAVANSCEDVNDGLGRCNPYTRSRIYRFYNGKFILFQEIPTAHAVQWLAIQMEDGVLVAVANALSGVKFYQYNGWRFIPTTRQHTGGPFSAGVTSMAAVSWNGNIMMGVTNHNTEYSSPQVSSLYTLTFSRDTTLEEFHMRAESWCRERIAQLKNENLLTLVHQVEGTPKVAQTYTFTVPVTIVGNLNVQGHSSALQIYIRGRDQWLPDRVNLLESLRVMLYDKLQQVRQRLDDTIPLAGPTTWPADLHLANLDARGTDSISVVDLLGSLVNSKVMEKERVYLRLSDLSHLKLDHIHFQHMEMQANAEVAMLQNRAMAEYVTLGGTHTMSGQVTFLRVINASQVTSSGTLDTIFVSPSTLLLVNTSQTHTGLIRCTTLEAVALNVHTINNINTEQLFESLVTSDNSAIITGELVIRADLRASNLKASATNLDLHNPLKIDETEVQVVTGHHQVGGLWCRSTRVAGKINGVSIPTEVFLSRSDYSYSVSSAAFTKLHSDAIHINTAFHAITVSNGYLDVLRVTGSQTVTAKKTFTYMRLLQRHTSELTYSGRRKRDVNMTQICGFLDDPELMEGEHSREALLWSLRRVAAARDVLTFLANIRPGKVTLLEHSASFYTKLSENVPCAFSRVDTDEGLITFDVSNLAWRKEEEADIELLENNIKAIMSNIEKYKEDNYKSLANSSLSWHDLFVMFDEKRTANHIIDKKDLIALRTLILVNNKHKNFDPQLDSEYCKMVCAGKKMSSLIATSDCLPGLLHANNVLKRINMYAVIVSNLTRLSSNQRQVLEAVVVERGVKKLLEMVRRDLQLGEEIRVASVCGTEADSVEVDEDIARMLESYERELKEAVRTGTRKKRETTVTTDSSWANGEDVCHSLPSHYRDNITSAAGMLSQLHTAQNFLQNMNSTMTSDVKVSASVQDVGFESYFAHHTGKVYNILKSLSMNPIQSIHNIDTTNLDTQATFFIHLLGFATRFEPPMSSAIKKQLDSLNSLLPVCMLKVTEVVKCLNLVMLNRNSSQYTTSTTFRASGDRARRHTSSSATSTFLVQGSKTDTASATTPMPRSGVSGSWVVGKVAGYKLEDLTLYHSIHSLSTSDPVKFIVTRLARVKNLVFEAVLDVPLVNTVEVARLRHHALVLDTQTLTVSLSFSRPVNVDGEVVVTDIINQVETSSYVTLSGSCVFSQLVTFTNDVEVQGEARVQSTINSIDLVTLRDSAALTTSSAQVFLTHVTFLEVAAFSVTFESGSVAGVTFSDLVLLNQTAVITGKKRFQEVVVKEGEVKVRSLEVDFVNDVNITALFLHSLKKNSGGAQVLSASVKLRKLLVLRNLTTRGFSALSSNEVFDISRIQRHLVYLDQTTIISGKLLLKGATSVAMFTFLGTFDGVPATRYKTEWLLKTLDQAIWSKVVLSAMICGNVNTAPGVKIQGVDLAHFLGSSLVITESEVVHFPVIFGEVISSWVSVSGLVQGWDLSEESVLGTASNVVFTASKTFLASVNISGSFLATQGFSGVDLDSLCGHISVHTLKVHGTVTFIRNVSSYFVHLGHYGITDGAMKEFWMKDENIILRESITIQLLEATNIYLITVNEVDLLDLSAHILHRNFSSTQIVSGVFTLDFLNVNSLYVDTVKTDTLNGGSVSDLLNIFTIDEGQVVTGHWKLRNLRMLGNLMTSGLVNGMRMTRFCQMRQKCFVHTRKTFTQDLSVGGNHYVLEEMRVQDVDVSESFSSVVSEESCGYIPGLTTFKYSLIIDENAVFNLDASEMTVYGLVDGVNMTTLILMTVNDEQVIKGHLTITSEGIALESDVMADNGLFNNFNLTELLERSYNLDHTQRVMQPVRFLEVVVFKQIDYYLWNTKMVEKVLNPPQVSYQSSFVYMYNLSRLLKWIVAGRVQEFWGWRLIQSFEDSPNRIIPLRLAWEKTAGPSGSLTLSSNYMALITSAGGTKLLNYSPATHQYEGVAMLPGNCTRSVSGYQRKDGEVFLVTGHACNLGDQAFNSSHSKVWGEEWGVRVHKIRMLGRPFLTTSIRVPGAADVQVLWWRGVVCLIVVETLGTDTVILCENSARRFSEKQRLHSVNPRKVSVAEHRDPLGHKWIFLAVADPGTSPDKRGASYIWWSDHFSNSFRILQEFELYSVVWVELASHHKDLYLVVVLETFRGDQKGTVNIYRMDWFSEEGATPLGHFGSVSDTLTSNVHQTYQVRPSFRFMQEVQVVEPLEARFSVLPSSPHLVLYVIDRQGFITHFTQRGIHRLWKEGVFHAAGKQTLEAWTTYVNGTLVHRISVAGQMCVGLEKTVPEERAMILEAIFRGKEP